MHGLLTIWHFVDVFIDSLHGKLSKLSSMFILFEISVFLLAPVRLASISLCLDPNILLHFFSSLTLNNYDENYASKFYKEELYFDLDDGDLVLRCWALLAFWLLITIN